MNTNRFEAQTYTLCQGRVNCWMVDDEPETFATEAEALAAIDEYIADYKSDIADPDYWPSKDDLRVAPVSAKAGAA